MVGNIKLQARATLRLLRWCRCGLQVGHARVARNVPNAVQLNCSLLEGHANITLFQKRTIFQDMLMRQSFLFGFGKVFYTGCVNVDPYFLNDPAVSVACLDELASLRMSGSVAHILLHTPMLYWSPRLVLRSTMESVHVTLTMESVDA